MTWGQWLLEYHALREKERGENEVTSEVVKAASNILRETLVGVLGLHLFSSADAASKSGASEGDDDVYKPTPFTPGALVFGNHHLLGPLIEERQKSEQETTAMQDQAFEEFSKRLASGDIGDMDPILTGAAPLPGAHLPGGAMWNSASVQQTLRALGVTQRPADAPEAPHVEGAWKDPRASRRRVVLDDTVPEGDEETK